jgi:hypothetical protein
VHRTAPHRTAPELKMNLLSRSLLRSACFSFVLLAGVANAADARDRLREISKEAQEVLQTMHQQLRVLQGYTMNDPTNPNSGRILSSGHYGVMDLQRSAQRLADLGSEANSRASKCDKSVRDVARDFQSQARRVNSATSRLINSRDSSSSSMNLNQVDFALQRAFQIVPSLGSITECSTDATETGEEGQGDEQADREKKKKEEEKGTEDYNE